MTEFKLEFLLHATKVRFQVRHRLQHFSVKMKWLRACKNKKLLILLRSRCLSARYSNEMWRKMWQNYPMLAIINYYTKPPIHGFTKMNGPINSETNISVWQLCANIHYWREEFNQFTFICVCSLGQLSAANNVNNSHKCSSDQWERKKWLSQFQMKIYKFIAKVNLIMLFELGTDKSNKKPNTMKSCKTGLPANFTHNHQKTHLIYSQVFFFLCAFCFIPIYTKELVIFHSLL